MCGIAGSLSDEFIKLNQYDLVKKMMKKRGPDSFGSYKNKLKNKKLNLFFSRLSIIDIKKRSNQPMRKFTMYRKKSAFSLKWNLLKYVENGISRTAGALYWPWW